VPRFPILSDENVAGPIVDGLRLRGWDVKTVYEVFGQHSVDETLFAHAAEQGRVLVSTDKDCLRIARRWAEELRPFRMVYWAQLEHQRVHVAHFLDAFEALGEDQNAFAAWLEYLNPQHS
jgi:predicted nuclease of predicted toxin-antitoxin system